MKAVVMAGGEGTRLRPLTYEWPKPFVRVAGKPAMEYAIEALVRAGIKDVIVTTFYKPERLMSHLSGGSRLGARIFYSVEDEALGTAGGVAKCLPLTGDDIVVVLSGDVIADIDIAALVKAHERSGAVATMALTTVENPTQFGIVGLDETGRIVRFLEKPKAAEVFSNLINTGIYVLSPAALYAVPQGEAFDFSKQLFPKLLSDGQHLQGVPIDGFWMDVGRPSDLLAASRALGERHRGGAALMLGRDDGDSTHTDVYEGARIDKGARVSRSILYDDAHIEKGAVVDECILAPGAVIEAGAHVTRCVLGRDARIPAGSKVHDVKLDPGVTYSDQA